MTTPTAFWDKVSAKYAASPIKDMDSYLHTLERTISYLSKDDHVLELGCGTGSTALLIAPHVHQITATDLSGKMIDIAKEKAWNDDVTNAKFSKSDVLGSSPDTLIDAVLAFNLLHLVEDLPAALTHIAKLVPSGGLFISKTPCLADGKWYFKPMIAVMRFFGKAPYVGCFSIEALEGRIEQAGFTIIENGSFPATPPSRYIVARRT